MFIRITNPFLCVVFYKKEDLCYILSAEITNQNQEAPYTYHSMKEGSQFAKNSQKLKQLYKPHLYLLQHLFWRVKCQNINPCWFKMVYL